VEELVKGMMDKPEVSVYSCDDMIGCLSTSSQGTKQTKSLHILTHSRTSSHILTLRKGM